MDKEYNIWIMVVSIKFKILKMLNIFPVKTVFLLKKKRGIFLKSVDFLALKKFTNEETNNF
jgi:hypothetical protein